jgi:hypothetical protein
MYTLTSILIVLSLVGAYKFFYKEEDIDDINKLYSIPMAFMCVLIPSITIVGLLYAILKYLP